MNGSATIDTTKAELDPTVDGSIHLEMDVAHSPLYL
jgi:hypothetical protein